MSRIPKGSRRTGRRLTSGEIPVEAAALRAAIKKRGHSHASFSKLVGVSQSLVTSWCLGARAPSVQQAAELSKALGIEDPSLICGDWAFVARNSQFASGVSHSELAAAVRLAALWAKVRDLPTDLADERLPTLLADCFAMSKGRDISEISAAELVTLLPPAGDRT